MKFFKDIKSKEVSRCRKSESPRRTGGVGCHGTHKTKLGYLERGGFICN